jgi:hypothetical protein
MTKQTLYGSALIQQQAALQPLALFCWSLLSFLRVFDKPIAMACLRLLTLPPFPPASALSFIGIVDMHFTIHVFLELREYRRFLFLAMSKLHRIFRNGAKVVASCGYAKERSCALHGVCRVETVSTWNAASISAVVTVPSSFGLSRRRRC